MWATYTPRIKSTLPSMFLGPFEMLFVCGGGECLCMDLDSGEIGDKFKPNISGRGTNISTLGHPTIGFSNMNACPVQQAVTVLGQCPDHKVSHFDDKTAGWLAGRKKRGAAERNVFDDGDDDEDNIFADEPDADNPFAEDKESFQPAFRNRSQSRGQAPAAPAEENPFADGDDDENPFATPRDRKKRGIPVPEADLVISPNPLGGTGTKSDNLDDLLAW